MADYGLTMEELTAAGCFDPAPPPPPPVVCYRNAEGLTWDGQGGDAHLAGAGGHAGQSVEFFRVG
ncbi:DNA-binding protein [Cupriavidus sp. UYMMa02A]|nr:DNA-binding protein [Cupriavidus sp. UYMMa02A]